MMLVACAVSPFAAVAAGGPTRWPVISTGGDAVCCADDEFCKAQVSLGAYTQTACAKACTAATCGPHGACNPTWMTSTSAQFIDPRRVSGFECHCAPGYGGEFCQWDADCIELDSTAESFSGSSMSDDNRYLTGNPRFHRASSTSSSSADPRKVKCNGHGACVPKGGGGRGFKCACEAGKVGLPIHLAEDASVSRSHAQFRIDDGVPQRLFITDLASRFHTLVDGERLEANAERELREGQLVIMGNGATQLRVATEPLIACCSRLKQMNKKTVKADLAKLGASTRDAFTEDCTHLITTDVADFTTKMVCALAAGAAVVTAGWIQAALARTNLADPLPPPQSFLPTATKLGRTLLSKYVVLLCAPVAADLEQLLRLTGAEVLRLHELDEAAIAREPWKEMKRVPLAMRTVDTGHAERQMRLLAQVQELGVLPTTMPRLVRPHSDGLKGPSGSAEVQTVAVMASPEDTWDGSADTQVPQSYLSASQAPHTQRARALPPARPPTAAAGDALQPAAAALAQAPRLHPYKGALEDEGSAQKAAAAAAAPATAAAPSAADGAAMGRPPRHPAAAATPAAAAAAADAAEAPMTTGLTGRKRAAGDMEPPPPPQRRRVGDDGQRGCGADTQAGRGMASLPPASLTPFTGLTPGASQSQLGPPPSLTQATTTQASQSQTQGEASTQGTQRSRPLGSAKKKPAVANGGSTDGWIGIGPRHRGSGVSSASGGSGGAVSQRPDVRQELLEETRYNVQAQVQQLIEEENELRDLPPAVTVFTTALLLTPEQLAESARQRGGRAAPQPQPRNGKSKFPNYKRFNRRRDGGRKGLPAPMYRLRDMQIRLPNDMRMDQDLLEEQAELEREERRAEEMWNEHASQAPRGRRRASQRTTCLPETADATDAKCDKMQRMKMIAKGEPHAAWRGGTLCVACTHGAYDSRLKTFIAAMTDTEKEPRKKRKL
ncbi:hypothetical protein JKP88DRAFT_332293 [Tribonema minus]|uniref:Uncharacterized protein n=1 Tax=Tribonema minus TaxID=303371 RepID=A0A836CAM5_9STRA|nr:hypothetical protein JKP88DRAFT_332293 [Tribonema minus]